MSRKLDNASWEEYINKFDSYKGTITLKDFCIENKLSKSQFYYHKKRLAVTNPTTPVFHAVSLNAKQDNIEKNILTSKEVKITIGTANITIPVSETTLIYSIIKELAAKC
ncbi:IS66 family insertion sequence element accessory protein TnpA [Clostridium beijerinckii]|jgi:hypothetical protein|uniref:Transposase n=1 Tax=Clostridium beijerinckii TaxID=1520 RepID=A0AAW3WGY6_CLOBE|nr:hypothetical protein [Clostridium beijerinckii]MBC2460530.1 hypothetical protein [Clostridium beijerinckii]MBC2478036.1 hypothetical protein [Clostridium beijerinckii]NOV59541.1 hypothetical protein [Clostridium beijerinckii]NOV59735.1 hypothetical protein [Clostridium beijerinckii]NOV59790.1 hypothetical protein [Clostridium beijerinckii]